MQSALVAAWLRSGASYKLSLLCSFFIPKDFFIPHLVMFIIIIIIIIVLYVSMCVFAAVSRDGS